MEVYNLAKHFRFPGRVENNNKLDTNKFDFSHTNTGGSVKSQQSINKSNFITVKKKDTSNQGLKNVNNNGMTT